MALTPGTRIGPHEVSALLGSGGMGEVYRARDTVLAREVAIKVLPDAFANDADRLARFEREARTLATLNHPHIAQVYGLERSGGTNALVMELVEGPTLADRIAQGPVPVDEALPIARQIAEALEAAHEQGIVHRDLKPANIKVRHDGTAKVLDFGLAKAMEPTGAPASNASQLPTITTPAMTQVGMILGTAAYMSPEQARGRPVDKRTDIWAFGCVLYEMLTGRRAFDGEDVSETLANVLKTQPDWSILPPDVSQPVRALLEGCLAKDRRQRVAEASTALFVMDKNAVLAEASPAIAQPVPVVRRPAWRRAVLTAGIAVATAVVTGTGAWVALRPSPPQVTRFFVAPPENTTFATGGRPATSAAISPDGRTLAFTARDGSGRLLLWVRPLDSLTAQPLAGTDDARFPFWSPDGGFIAFFTQEKLLKIAVAGGPPQTVCGAPQGRGGTWALNGVIVFGMQGGPLFRVSSAGGEPSVLTRLAKLDLSHRFPAFLPDSNHVLFHVDVDVDGVSDDGIRVASMETGGFSPLVAADSGAAYDGRSRRLLFVREGTLLAQRFDLDTQTLKGEPSPVAERVEVVTFNGLPSFSVSETGVLVYGVGLTRAGLQMEWVDRQGMPLGTAGPESNTRGLDLSPDGTMVATHRHDGDGGDIWLTDISRDITSRFTLDATQENSSPVWSPDSRRIAYASRRAGRWGIYAKSTGGGEEEQLLDNVEAMTMPMSWSSEGGCCIGHGVSRPMAICG